MKKKKIEYFYFGGNSLHAGLYAELVQALNRCDLNVTLVLKNEFHYRSLFAYLFTCREKRMIGPHNAAKIHDSLQGKIITIPYITGLPYIGKAVFFMSALWVFFRKSLGCDLLVIHAKNTAEYALFIKKFLLSKKIKILSEIEGDIPSEIEYVMNNNYNSYLWSGKQKKIDKAHKMQKWVVEKSDLVICVTERLKNLICERFSISETHKFHIYPTFASSKVFYFDKIRRDKMRKRLEVNGRFIVLYCGNLGSKWQVPELLVKMFAMIKDVSENAFFYILTPQSDQAFILPYLEALHVSDYAFAEVDHSDVIDYLCMADCALVLREKHIMNEVASPGKFAEYALTGLPIVMTNSIGYYSDAMKGSSDALILENLKDEEMIKTKIAHFVIDQIPKIDRKEFARWSRDRFSLEVRVPDLIREYKAVGDE
jgi:glycosyltransferase involved in cell wall biosynthesis